ncbi:MAG: MerR family transcriptional regulator [Parvibaculaceae bacterium]
MEKSPDAFRTISEAAEELDVPQHVLRFWETRFAQIKPLKRGGGRRYYRPSDVELLKGIRHLLYGKGYTIRGVQRILREDGVAHVAAIGRGEVDAEAETPEAPDVGRAPPAPAVPGTPLRTSSFNPALALAGPTASQKQELQRALTELENALRLLGTAR